MVVLVAEVPTQFRVADRQARASLSQTYARFVTRRRAAFKINVVLVDTLDPAPLEKLGARYTRSNADHLYVRDPRVLAIVRSRSRKGIVWLPRDNFREAFGTFLRFLHYWFAEKSGWTCLHASCAVKEGRAFLFSGPSGAGKSTAVGMLEGVEILHDDQIYLCPSTREPRIAALPYMGRDDFLHDRQASFPVAAIYLLHKSLTPRLVPLSPAAAAGRILAVAPAELSASRVARPSKKLLSSTLERCARLAMTARCFELYFSLTEMPAGVLEVP